MEEKMKFAFVVLHYQVIDETIACVNSIKKKLQERPTIVIVDNASPNGSGETLQSLYENDNQVVVIRSPRNLGFAKGNNIGISYARDVVNADILVVTNNDTVVVQTNFLELIEEEWKRSEFAVLGPRINTYSGDNQNPVMQETTTLSDVEKSRHYHMRQLVLAYTGLYVVWDYLKKLKRNKITNRAQKKVGDERREDVKLHGSCLIFSDKFFNHFRGFNPETFMYGEEDLLILQVRQKKLLSVYNPNIEIFHAEKAATKSSTKSSRKKKIFIHKECLKSLKIIEKVITNSRGNNEK